MPVVRWDGIENVEQAASLVGPRIRELRELRGLSIRELAERAEISKNTLLRLEQGEPIAEPKMHRVCDALQTILPQLLLNDADYNANVRVHRDNPAGWFIAFTRKRAPSRLKDYQVVPSPEERLRLGHVGFVSAFAQTHDCALRNGKIRSAVLEIFGDQERPGFRHSGEEFVYCLAGRLRLTVGGEITILNPGDSATFRAHLRHRYESDLPAGELTRMLMVWIETEEMREALQHDEECEE